MRIRVGIVAGLAAAAAMIVPAAASAHTRVVYAGGTAKFSKELAPYAAGVDNFLVHRITIHVGDTVVWNGASLSSGFHTVDIPALHASDLPLIIPTGSMVSGATDAAGNPFWFNGIVPNLGLNPELFTPSGTHRYNGTSRVDSGLPIGKPHNFKVTFTRVGKYNYFCDVHPGMGGQVIVKRMGTRIPSARKVAAQLRRDQAHFLAEAKRVARTRVRGNRVDLGASGPGGVEIFAMFPATLRIKVGTTVKFVMPRHDREAHTATFGPAKYRDQLSKSITSPSINPAAIYPSDPPGHIVLTRTSHGNGFANTGALDRDSSTPLPPLNTITFNQKGTYNYQCLIHPFMRARIIVHP